MINFEKILKEKGVSKAELARFLEIDANNVNRTIRNENITLSKIESICSFLDISVIDAFRLSGYNDTSGVTPKEAEKEKILDYKNLLLSLSDQIVELYNQKILAPYTVVEGKEEEIRQLNREIGKLESDNEKLKEEIKQLKLTETQDNNIQDYIQWKGIDPIPSYKSGIQIRKGYVSKIKSRRRMINKDTPITLLPPGTFPLGFNPIYRVQNKEQIKLSTEALKNIKSKISFTTKGKHSPESGNDKPTTKL